MASDSSISSVSCPSSSSGEDSDMDIEASNFLKKLEGNVKRKLEKEKSVKRRRNNRNSTTSTTSTTTTTTTITGMTPTMGGGGGGRGDHEIIQDDSVKFVLRLLVDNVVQLVDLESAIGAPEPPNLENISADTSGINIPPLPEFSSFQNYVELTQAITDMEVKTRTNYTYEQRNRAGNTGFSFDQNVDLNSFLTSINDRKDIKIKWHLDEPTPIKFLGWPFIFLAKRDYHCHKGKDTNKKSNAKKKVKKQQNIAVANVSEHYAYKTRVRNQPSKKVDCPARFNVKKVLFFPQFGVEIGTSKYEKGKVRDKLLDALMLAKSSLPSDSSGGGGVETVPLVNSPLQVPQVLNFFITKFPELSDHKNHFLGIAAGIGEKTDERVVEYVKEMARKGIRNKDEMDRQIRIFVEEKLNITCDLTLRSRFQPSHQKLRNIISAVRAKNLHSRFDQENIQCLKSKWMKNAKVYFLPKGARPALEDILDKMDRGELGFADEETWDDTDQIPMLVLDDSVETKLCLVYQSTQMQHLYRLYGPRLILLDATHKTTKYALPLFFLVVQTNVNYQVAGVIVLEDESADLILKALGIIKGWNPDVNPKYGMVDFDTGEILSLETIFPGITVFLCDFHREQSWGRWTSKRSHDVYNIKADVLYKFRRVANAFSEVEYNTALAHLREWENYGKISVYFENTWLPEIQRWCLHFRPDDLFNCNTNNGTERLNEALKHGPLKDYHCPNLSELMTLMIDSFLPKLYEKYVILNIESCTLHKQLNEDLPEYLHNRPKKLVEHCRSRLQNVSAKMTGNVEETYNFNFRAFFVTSFELEQRRYIVKFGNAHTVCSCDCADFKRHRLLCKHFFAVFFYLRKQVSMILVQYLLMILILQLIHQLLRGK